MAKALPASPQESPSNESISPGAKQRRTRNRIACDDCHSQHARCDRVFPCSRCLRKNIQCSFSRELRKRGRLPKHSPRPGNGIMKGAVGLYNADTSSPDAQYMISPTASDGSQQSSCYLKDVPVLLSQGIEYPQSLDELDCAVQRCEKADVLNESLLFQDTSGDFPDLLTGIDLEDGSFPLDTFTPTDFPQCSSPRHAGSEKSTLTPPPTLLSLRYPVLQPLLPFIESTVSGELACELLDLYFTSAFPDQMHPLCHHIHCYVVRKASFLDETSPRPSSPALLASMLWVAASDDRAFSLPMSPCYRKQICHLLHSLTVQLLKPLAHTPTDGPRKTTRDRTPYSNIDLANLPGFAQASPMPNSPPGNKVSVETIDDVITYIHIASILSASEQKALSMQWWYAAFTLARELKLNREVETMPAMDFQSNNFSQMDCLLDFPVSNRRCLNCVCNDRSTHTTEEQREERRRVWWLLYIMDRHLALRDNRPLVLLDSESKDLLPPLDEGAWQAGGIHSNGRNPIGPQCLVFGPKNKRRGFPDFTCHDKSIFGFFLPLMMILGQVVDLNQMENHPILGAGALGKKTLETYRNQVLRQLGVYEVSLNESVARSANIESASSSDVSHLPTHSAPQSNWMSRTIAAYASYYVQVLHILLDEKWDSTILTEDKHLFTSSPNFTLAISRALKAAASVNQILKFDPDISFMPAFFETHLLRGSFYFLLIIEQLQDKADEPFLSACEVMIRAMESCIVTLNTESQRSLCQIMRSAVAQARGRPINHCEVQRRHRAILALSRQTGTGAGLAL
ncbi:fungal-specific transcription factor domain-containing protein [Aspergillus keveii]|uniref:Fungal-specific transcription factor domain-containing protein n=1 Tax=Aspergillus keveii TaxID=714993 RepID=A0ABR4FM68_9EURO